MAVSRTTTVNQQFGYLFGAVYALVGIVGFVVTADVGFVATEGNNLIIFGLNPLHNVIHVAVGALFIAGARMGERTSRQVNLLVGGVYLLVGVVGFALVGTSANIIALNQADNLLHLATAAVALGVGSGRLALPVRH
ncbi:MAG: DUF4383 domain-containing protein [Acidimicrobiia bacterium]